MFRTFYFIFCFLFKSRVSGWRILYVHFFFPALCWRPPSDWFATLRTYWWRAYRATSNIVNCVVTSKLLMESVTCTVCTFGLLRSNDTRYLFIWPLVIIYFCCKLYSASLSSLLFCPSQVLWLIRKRYWLALHDYCKRNTVWRTARCRLNVIMPRLWKFVLSVLP